MNELPLLELFSRLRAAGIPLDLRDYEALLCALSAGYGLPGSEASGPEQRAALSRLCQTLWVRSAEDQQLFDYHFDRLIDHKLTAHIEQPKSSATITKESTKLLWKIILIIVAGWSMFIYLGISIWPRTFNPVPQASVSPSPQPTGPDPTPKPTVSSSPSPIAPTTTSVTIVQPEPTNNQILRTLWIAVFIIMFVMVLADIFLGILSVYLSERQWQHMPKTNQELRNSARNSLRSSGDIIQVTQVVQQVNSSIERRFTILRQLINFVFFSGKIAVLKQNAIQGYALTQYNLLNFNQDYRPATQRQMNQQWRQLRWMVQASLIKELDVERTVQQVARQEILLEPVMKSRRINYMELLILLDSDGSMVAFHSLADRLLITAQNSGKLGRSGVYYFHNCPINHLYQDARHLESEAIESVLARSSKDRTAVLIFSDGGAARGGLNQQRLAQTEKFLHHLQSQTKQVVWLNPMPKNRWQSTTAAAIAQRVPMFESTHQDLILAIRTLSRKTPKEFPSGGGVPGGRGGAPLHHPKFT